MLIDQKHLKVKRLPYLFKNVVKPNLTRSAPRKFQIKALGFTRSLVDAVYLEKVVFFCDFHVFGSIRSTQPTMLSVPGKDYKQCVIHKEKTMKILINVLLITLLILPPAFAAADKQTSDVTSLYHIANILGIQVSLAQTENIFMQKTSEQRVTDFATFIDAAKEIGLELQERNLNYEELRKFKTPVIAHLKTTLADKNPPNVAALPGHFVVVEYMNKKWVRLFDTPGRLLYQAATVVSRDRFLDRWTGRVLALSENQRQQKQPVLSVFPTLLDLDALITLQYDFADQDLAGYQFPVRLKNRSDVPIRIVSVAGNT